MNLNDGSPQVKIVLPYHHEGAPGPSLGTGDIDTMQVLTSTRTMHASTTPPRVCPLSTAFTHPSISTSKERDAESSNDYFEAGCPRVWIFRPGAPRTLALPLSNNHKTCLPEPPPRGAAFNFGNSQSTPKPQRLAPPATPSSLLYLLGSPLAEVAKLADALA